MIFGYLRPSHQNYKKAYEQEIFGTFVVDSLLLQHAWYYMRIVLQVTTIESCTPDICILNTQMIIVVALEDMAFEMTLRVESIRLNEIKCL